jgi:hypothetical protein
MTDYRLYFLNPASGGIVAVEDVVARGDDHALVVCEKYHGPQPLELWCGSRRVAEIEGEDWRARATPY